MTERVFLIHGWSVTRTTTYAHLHTKLAENGFTLHEIFLGRYVSLDNDVTVSDIASAMHNALTDILGGSAWTEPFHIITHSTGALVTKDWIVRHYIEKFCRNSPLQNVVFLAGPHFGSRLAHHGRSMLSHAIYLGDTGRRVLRDLELGSPFSWENNGFWMDAGHWKDKGIRPYCITGDRVLGGIKNTFGKKVFPAGFEEGSDMVVRVAAANLNFRRFLLREAQSKPQLLGGIDGVPFAALENYVHSGDDGIMGSITSRATPESDTWLNLRLILRCLKTKSNAAYSAVSREFKSVTDARRKSNRGSRQAFTQLDFRFRDQRGAPITDYKFTLGVLVNGKRKPSKTVAHTHKNKIDESHFTVFINLKEFEPRLTYFFEIDADTDTPLVHYRPDPYHGSYGGKQLGEMISADRTTQFEVELERESSRNLFVFHPGDDPRLPVTWDREGNPT